jgi:hypothetical protein
LAPPGPGSTSIHDSRVARLRGKADASYNDVAVYLPVDDQ